MRKEGSTGCVFQKEDIPCAVESQRVRREDDVLLVADATQHVRMIKLPHNRVFIPKVSSVFVILYVDHLQDQFIV